MVQTRQWVGLCSTQYHHSCFYQETLLKKWLLLSLRRQELYLINGQTSEAVVCTVNRIKYHSFTVGQRKITTDGMMFFFVFLDWKCILSFQKSNNLSLSSGMGRIKPVTPTGQDRVMERQRIRYKYKVGSLDFQGIKNQREQKHHQYTSIFKFTLPHSHKHTRAHTRTHTENFYGGIKVSSTHAFYLLSSSLLHY